MKNKIALLLISVIIIAGCSRQFHRTTIKSNPAGADVFINNKLIGRTPLVFYEKEGEISYLFRIEKKGYEPYVESIDTTAENAQKASKKNFGIFWRAPLIRISPCLPDELNFNLRPKQEGKEGVNQPAQ